ncbi:MAG TPA: type 4a pilus biogenesis protein PilO [Actinomycetes bacterium]
MGRRRELIVSILVGVLVLAGVWALLIRPKGGQAAAAQADERAAISQADTLRGQIRALEQVRSEAGSLRARAREAGDLFPAKPDLPDLTTALQRIADQAGVDLVSIQPTPPAASTASPDLATLTATVAVGGGYFEIEDFLARLENLVKSPDPASHIPPRSVLVGSVNIASASGATGSSGGAAVPSATTGSGTLTANISVMVFQHAKVQAPAGAGGAAAATATTTAPTTTTPPPTTASGSATTRPAAYVPPAGHGGPPLTVAAAGRR